MKILPLSIVRNLKLGMQFANTCLGNGYFNERVVGLGKLNILQIGAGGTGGYVAAEIMRMIGGLPPFIQKQIRYTLVDGDVFEPKNLGRQLCTPDDLGLNKALSIVDNYSGYFGCVEGVCNARDTYIKSVLDIKNIIGHTGDSAYKLDLVHDVSYLSEKETTIIIDCVDKTTPRSYIQEYWDKYNSGIAIGERLQTLFDVIDNPSAYIHISDTNLKVLGENTNIPLYTIPLYFCGITNNNYRTLYVISSGNGEFTGQVVLGRLCRMIGGCKPVTLTDFMDELPALPTFTKKGSYPIHRNGVTTRAVLENLYASYANPLDHTSNSSILTYADLNSNDAYDKSINPGTLFNSYYTFMQHFVSSPSPYQLFPELIDISADEKEDQLSCADRAAQNVQHINANKTASMLVINYFTTILKGLFPLDAAESPAFSNVGVKFNCLQNAMQEIKITDSLLKSC